MVTGIELITHCVTYFTSEVCTNTDLCHTHCFPLLRNSDGKLIVKEQRQHPETS